MHVESRNLSENMPLFLSSYICQNKAAMIVSLILLLQCSHIFYLLNSITQFSPIFCSFIRVNIVDENIHSIILCFMDSPDFWQSIHISGPIHPLCCNLSHVRIEVFAINHMNAFTFFLVHLASRLFLLFHLLSLCM